MTPTEYDEMVRLVETWWGPVAAGPWQESENYDLFADLQTDPVFETLTSLRDSGRYNDWPPKPPALRAAALDLIRNSPGGALALPAAPVEAYTWAEYSKRTYGERVDLDFAVSLAAAAQDAGVPPPSPQNPWRRPEQAEQEALYDPFREAPDPPPRQSGYERDVEPPPPESEPERRVVAGPTPSKRGGPCDHCGQHVAKGGLVTKLSPACCDVEAHQRPSRTSGGAGSWVCQECAP